jgi:hypothetical protein
MEKKEKNDEDAQAIFLLSLTLNYKRRKSREDKIVNATFVMFL